MAKGRKKLGKRDMDFLYEVGSLGNVERGWRQSLGMSCANDLEHTLRVCWIALILARAEGGVDENLVLKMALLHDVAETRTSDHAYVQKVYVTADEERAARDLFAGTIVSDLLETLDRYEHRDTPEAKIVKDADNLDVDVELRELEERGSQMRKKWAKERRFVRDTKLYTASAKKLWDLIQTTDPADWHRASSKWKHIPSAGR